MTASWELNQSDTEALVDTTFVRSVRYFDKICSTNDRALASLSGLTELPALFITPRQSAGRGRGTNTWHSSPGALTFSLVVDPAAWCDQPHAWPQLSLWTALGIRDAIAEQAPQADVQVKWPNDVYLRQRKVCGILIENALSGQTPRLVVGVGINVNNSLPPTGQPANSAAVGSRLPEAISLHQVCGEVPLVELTRSVLQHLADAWSLFSQQASLHLAWQTHCLLSGRTVRWQSGTQSRSGVCRGIDDQGALLLQTSPTDAPRKCYGGTIAQIEWDSACRGSTEGT